MARWRASANAERFQPGVDLVFWFERAKKSEPSPQTLGEGDSIASIDFVGGRRSRGRVMRIEGQTAVVTIASEGQWRIELQGKGRPGDQTWMLAEYLGPHLSNGHRRW